MSSSRRASKKLFVANLSSKTKEKDLEDVFKEYGKVESLIIREGRSGDRFAFVEFDTVEEAENANERVNGFELSGKALRVEFARPQRERGDGDRDRGDRGDRDRGDRGDRDRGERGAPPGGCYICKERNHQAKDCPRGNGKVGACYICGSRGHRMKECKGKGGSRRGRSSSRSRSRSSSGRKRRSDDRRKRSESGSRSRGNRGSRRNDRDDRKRSSRDDRKKSRSRSNKKSPSSD